MLKFCVVHRINENKLVRYLHRVYICTVATKQPQKLEIMKVSNDININFELDVKIYEATIYFNSNKEEDFIYKALNNCTLDGCTLDSYEEGEINVSIDSKKYGFTKKEFIKELKNILKR